MSIISKLYPNRIVNYFKKMTAFSFGMFVGVVYGSIVASLTAWTMLSI